MSRSTQLAKNTLILSIGTFLPRVVSFVTLPILTGYLTKTEYGTYDLVSVMVSLLLPSVTLQIRTAAFRYLIDAREDPQKQNEIITSILTFTVPVSLAALTILFFALRGIDPQIRLWICLYYLFDMLVSTIRQIARGLSFNLKYACSAIISAVGKTLFLLVLVWHLQMGLLGAVVSLCCGALLSLIYMSMSIRIWKYVRRECFSTSTIRTLLGYSWPLVPNELSLWIMRVSDRFVVTTFMGLAANAVYSVANKIPSIISLAQTSLTLAWQENATIASRDEDASAYYSEMFHAMMRIQSGFLCLVLGATPFLFRLLIRGSYQEAYNQMPVLCLGIFYSSMATYLGGIYVAYRVSKSVGITTAVAAAINIVTDILMIRWIGLYAASGSTLISYIALFLYRKKDINKYVHLEYNRKTIILLHLIMFAVCGLFYVRGGLLVELLYFALGTALFVGINRDLVKVVCRKVQALLRNGR